MHSIAIRTLLPADSPRLEGENRAHILRLTEVESPLPPILVHRQTMRVIDGMHRLRAAMLRGEKEIRVTFFDGSGNEAFLRGVEMNIAHGLPLTHADRRAAAVRIMAAEPQLSDRAVADRTGLAARTVAALRRSTAHLPRSNRRVGVNGRSWPVDGARGRRLAAEYIAARPDASLREVAKAAGISLSTAHDVRKRLLEGRDPLPAGLAAARSRPHPAALASPRLADAEDGGGRTSGRGGGAGRAEVLRRLMKDPSLRHSAPGRELLRMLNAQVVTAGDWAGLADTVPAHCADAIARLARETAAAWEQFAEALDRR
ncbi:ParB/RepB/Spo0J family partition protein [Actinomadura sediminis]|uniref:ParB/RepB/Spo0J family partition protein n=1 Tax=Actinomadura sediminis TaxID=1038904 RepID=A0ABW3EJ50_9ACTN